MQAGLYLFLFGQEKRAEILSKIHCHLAYYASPFKKPCCVQILFWR